MPAFVAYLRVSTQKQGLSGLGIEAQQAAVASFLREGDTVISTFTETESGRNCDRPQLKAALAECRRHRATLLIARWDRLGRNVRFLAELLEGDVEIRCCDNPHATKFVLHIMSAVAAHEADLCSTRTKAALAAARARGTRLGGYRGVPPTPEAGRMGRAARTAKANARALDLIPAIARARAAGACTPSAISRWLASNDVPTPTGDGAWQAIMVTRIIARVAA